PVLAGIPLHIVGDGPDREALLTRATTLGIAERVTWHGTLKQPEVATLYRSTEAVAMPSRGEGLGLVAVEAQLCGTPVVAYADGGLPDVVRPEQGGTLVGVGNIAALASGLAHIIRHRGDARERGLQAQHAMLARFSPDAVAQTY